MVEASSNAGIILDVIQSSPTSYFKLDDSAVDYAASVGQRPDRLASGRLLQRDHAFPSMIRVPEYKKPRFIQQQPQIHPARPSSSRTKIRRKICHLEK
jgi:hypothetical protein